MNIGSLDITVITQAIALEWTYVELAHPLYEQHQFFRSVPTVEEDTGERESLISNGRRQHLADMVEFGLAITIRIEQAIVHNPILTIIGIDIKTIDYPNAFYHTMRITAILSAHHFDAARVIFIKNRVIENKISIRGLNNIPFNIIPDNSSCQFIPMKKTGYGIMTKAIFMLSQVRHGVIFLSRDKKLAIIQSAKFHSRYLLLPNFHKNIK